MIILVVMMFTRVFAKIRLFLYLPVYSIGKQVLWNVVTWVNNKVYGSVSDVLIYLYPGPRGFS